MPCADGERTTIWVEVTDSTVASWPWKTVAEPEPNSTCTGASKPVPVIVTRVPPSLGPPGRESTRRAAASAKAVPR